VEVEWFIALSDAGFSEFPALSEPARGVLRKLVLEFSQADAQAIKDIERTTNHDVKAVEYWLKGHFEGHPELKTAGEFVHFACTSEDINNTSHGLMLQAARTEVLLPSLQAIIDRLTSPDNVVVASMSSVGFGLSPASGHAIRDLVIDGACSFNNIDLLKLSRFDGLEKDWREKRGWMPIA